MVKQGEIVVYKNIGTYQLLTEAPDEYYDGDRFYQCRHLYSGQECIASTIKEAKKCIEDLDKTAQEIQAAIQKLKAYGYQVVKVIE